ncbi:MAG TPA: transposase [Micromonosporaceae bacterium]
MSRRHADTLKRDLKAIYEAPNVDAAEVAFEELDGEFSKKCPDMVRLWRNAWTEFVPFLDYDIEIRTTICSTNVIESLNARYRRAVRARALPDRTSSDELPVPCHPEPRPDRDGSHTMDEARDQRMRHHVR